MTTLCGNCQVRPVVWVERCRRCHVYRDRNGVERPASVDQRGTERPCKEPGCTVTLRYPFRGYCRRHYDQWHQKNVRLTKPKPAPPPLPEPVRIKPARLGCPHCGRLLVQGQCPMQCAS